MRSTPGWPPFPRGGPTRSSTSSRRSLHEWAEHDGSPPRAARWVVFRDVALRGALERAHRALVAEPPGDLAIEEAVLGAVAAPASPSASRTSERGRRARRARARCAGPVVHLHERWDERVSLAELAEVAGLSRFELVRRFGDQNDITPHAFQTNLRIAQARRLLLAAGRRSGRGRSRVRVCRPAAPQRACSSARSG